MGTPRILAAVGIFPPDHAVLARGLEISRASGADMHIVHVLDLPGDPADLDDISTFLGQAAFAARDRIKAALIDVDADVDTAAFAIHIELGAHALRLIEICDELRPDLVVMRAHQKTRISERILGSTTDRVIADGQAPVLVVKRPVERPYEQVVLATNGVDGASDAVRFIAGLLPQARLHMVAVIQIPPQLEEAMLSTGTRKAELSALRKKMITSAEENLHWLMSKWGPGATSKVLKGDPAKVLTRLCRSPQVDLMTLGTGRPGLIRRAFIGSVSRRLLRDAACDVLICPFPSDAP